MAMSRSAWTIRLSGWIVSLVGMALLVLSGGWSDETKYYFMAGAVLMVVGMILTSTSGLVAHLQHMRSLRKPPAPPPASPSGPPA